MIPRKIQKATKGSLYSKMADRLETTFYALATAMFHAVRTDRALARRFRNDVDLRVAWTVYALRALLTRTCAPSQAGKNGYFNQEAMLKALEYDRRTALRLPRIVGLTGDPELDIVSNFFAHKAAGFTPEVALPIIENIYKIAIGKFCDNVRHESRNTELLPFMTAETDQVGIFFDYITAVEKKHPANIRKVLLRNVESFDEVAILNAHVLPYLVASPTGQMVSSVFGSQGVTLTAKGQDLPSGHEIMTQCIQAFAGTRPGPDGLPVDALAAIARGLAASASYHGELRQIQRTRELEDTLDDWSAEANENLDYIRTLQSKCEELRGQISAERCKAQQEWQDKLSDANARIRDLGQAVRKEQAVSAKLQSERDKLAAQARALDDQSDEIDALRAQVAWLTPRLQELIDMLSSDRPDEETKPQDGPSDPSVLDGLSIIIVGGTPAFTTTLKALCPGVKCTGLNPPTQDALAHADAVWLQTRYIDHKTSVPLVDACRRKNIPLLFLKSKSAAAAAGQIIRETPDAIQGR